MTPPLAPDPFRTEMESRLHETHTAARELRGLSTARKNQLLARAAEMLLENQEAILAANRRDLEPVGEAARAFVDRLTLNPARIQAMAASLLQVAELPDPVGEIVEARRLPNGLVLKRVRAPLGVILVIFESRPNVAIEAFSLAFKSGNATILRGGKESMHTVGQLYAVLEQALSDSGVTRRAFWGFLNPDRVLLAQLLKEKRWIDVVVPRGGDGLIDFVVRESRIPIIKNDRGLCHVYVHSDAELLMAVPIVVNAKTQRPGVCNAMETLLVHAQAADQLLPSLHDEMIPFQVEWRCCPRSLEILRGRPRVSGAQDADWDTEHLDFIMNCRVVESLDEAIRHIEQHGSRHSEAIVCRDEQAARKFQCEVDAAAVYWNASTRFTDGFELGLGGELGISTQKLHVRGPVGLNELTSIRWVIDGAGHIRS